MRPLLTAALLALATAAAHAQLAPATQAQIAQIAAETLKTTGVPSASIGIVQNGRIVYTRAFGLANTTPPKPAQPEYAYPIGSISKQFTATAVLLLQQQGKLSIDDPVARYFPNSPARKTLSCAT
jgi:D-alanyl-D-alanine carboxypeptidase